MFERLFAESGLSLDRLRALVEVGAAGSIVRAAGQDAVRQSQYSRQIKELEDFFQIGLVERHGKGIRLTTSGRELARISRFFLLGLANFQRGCLAEGQTYRLGAGPTYLSRFLVPALAQASGVGSGACISLEGVWAEEVEGRLHDLTLDFGVVDCEALSRPLKLEPLGAWKIFLWIPKKICRTEKQAIRYLGEGKVRLVWPTKELPMTVSADLTTYEPALRCDSFLQARQAVEGEGLATVMPEYLEPEGPTRYLRIEWPQADRQHLRYFLAWNPRLLRLNPHAGRMRDALVKALRATERGA